MNWIKTMNELDIAAWERELNHAQVMQEQRASKRKVCDSQTHTLHGEQKRYLDFCGYKLMERNDNEIN